MKNKNGAKSGRKKRSTRRRGHFLSPLKIGIGLGVIAIGVALYFSPMFGDSSGPVNAEKPSGVSTLLTSPGLPENKPPINKIDPVTGNAIEAFSPSLFYKGYKIAFCCDQSSGYTGGWDKLSEAKKDAFVQQCLK